MIAQTEGQPITFSRGTSEAVTIVGELYWNLGVFGVVIGMFVFGLAFRVTESIAMNRERSVAQVMLYAITLAMLFEQFRGDFATILLNYLLAGVCPLVLVIFSAFLVKRFKRTASGVNIRA